MLTDVQVESFKSNGDMSGTVFRFVKITAAQTVGPITGLGQVTCGVQQNVPSTATGATIDVKHTGRTSVYATAAAIAVGVKVAPDAVGKARTAAAGDHVGGISRSATDGTAAQPMIDIIVTLGGAPLP